MKLRNLLYLVPLLLVGCDIVEFRSYDEIVPGTVKVSPTSVEYSYSGGNTELTVSSATPWTVEFVNDADADWVSVAPTSGQAGDTKVTLTVKPFAPKDLTRENIIKFVGKDGSAAGISFKQAWAEPKTEYKFNKATRIVDGRSYLIVADGNAASVQSSNYGYLYNPGSVVDVDGVVTLASKSLAWTFTAVEGGYTIKGSDDRYLYQTGTYNSFNFSATRIDGDVWAVEFQEDGSAKITNVSVDKYMQYSTGYVSYGSYATAQEGGVVPCLYEEEVDPNAATLIPSDSVVVVAADATEAVFQIGSGNDWVVECDSDWITSYTAKGSGDGEVAITFGKNNNFDEERTAVFKVYGSGIEANVTVVQSPVVPVFEVKESAISLEAMTTRAVINIESNLPWEIVCPSGAEALSPTGSASAQVSIFLVPNNTGSDVVYNVVVRTSSDRVEKKEYTVVITQKTNVKIPVPYRYAFESDFGEFSVEDKLMPETATYIWSADTKNKCLKASAYIGNKNYASESWVVSPTMDLSTLPATKAVVEYAMNYGTYSLYAEQMYFMVIDGSTQTRINFATVPAKGSWTFYKEEIDLTPWAGKNIKLAFVYTSTNDASATFEIKSISFEQKTTTLEELNAMASSSESDFEVAVKDVVVSYVNGSNAFIQDATAGTQIYFKGHGLAAGKKIDGTVSGKIKLYNDYAEITAIDLSGAVLSDVTFTPEVITVADLISNYPSKINKMVCLKGVTVSDGIANGDRNGVISQNGSEINLYASVNGITIETGAKGDLICIPTLFKGAKQVGVYENNFFSPDDGGEPEPPQPVTSEYSIDLAYTLGANSYDNGAATVNGESIDKTLKIGTSSNAGEFTLTVPAGTKKITYYAIAWKGAATTVEFYQGETLIKSQDVAANDGATGNPPYKSISVTEADKYVIEKEFDSETQIRVTTASGAKTRAILFGIKAEK